MADNWQLKAVLSAVDKMSPVLKSVGGVAKTTRKYLADVASAANGLTSKIGLPLTALGGVISGFSAVAIKRAVESFTELGESIYNASLRTGMSTDELQRMKYVAEQAGVAFDSFQGSIGKLNRNIGEAAAGKNKKLAGLFDVLKISTRNANGELKGGIDLLPQLADAFKRNQNPVVQARMGMALFGKSWQEIVPLLADGSAGITESLERFKRLKGIISQDDLKGAKELGDKFKDLDFVTKGFQNTIAKELVPVLTPVIEDIVQWAGANRKLVATEVKNFVRDLVAGMKAIDWKGAIESTKSLAKNIGWLVDKVGGARNALIGLALVMNAQTIVAAWGLVAAIGRMVWSLGVLTVTSVPAAVSGLSTLTMAMVSANAGGVTMLGTVGLLITKLGLLAAAATAGYAAGSWINDHVINAGVQSLTGDKDQTLGGWVYDKLHPDNQTLGGWVYDKLHPDNQDSPARPSLLPTKNTGRVEGQVNININGLPQGSRVEQVKGSGNMPLNLSAGYSSSALGMP